MSSFGNFMKTFDLGSIGDNLANIIAAKKKKEAAAAVAEAEAAEAAAKAEEESTKSQISYHKEAKTSIADKDHPDWHLNNFKQMNLQRELAKDKNMPPLNVWDYRHQFMKDVYKPEDYTKWGNVQASNKANVDFMPTDEQKELGQAFIQYEREKSQASTATQKLEKTGIATETDIEARLNKMEKQKYVAGIYNAVQTKAVDDVQKEYPGLTTSLIEKMKTTGTVRGILAGQDEDVPPIWTERDQQQYVRLVRTYNQAKGAQGEETTYSMTQGRTRAQQLVEMNLLERKDEHTPEDIEAAEGVLTKEYPKFVLSPKRQAVLDSLQTSIGNLETKYGNQLHLQFEEVKKKLKWREEEEDQCQGASRGA